MMRELLIGCGHNRKKRVHLSNASTEWENLTTLDQYAACLPDMVWNLNNLPYPFENDTFDEIHAYCVLEHCGTQGDWKFFFDQWTEFWRITKPGGLFCAITPRPDSPWAWGDPSHTRIIGLECLNFLSQDAYALNRDKGSSMSDFTWYYKADWTAVVAQHYHDSEVAFILRANKDQQKKD